MKKFFKLFIPPIFLNLLKRQKWIGHYESFSQIDKKYSYANLNVAEKCFNSAEKVFLGEYPFERDGYLFNQIEYSFGLLSALFYVGSSLKNIRVIDFGGGFGTTFIQNRILESFFSVSWVVVEQKNYVDKAKNSDALKVIQFYENLESLDTKNFNVILFSSVLQYLENPEAFLVKICQLKIKYIILDRTPILNSSCRSYVTRQVNDKKVQDSSYPCWQFSEANLLNEIEKYYSRIFKWNSNIDESNFDVKFCGYLYRLNE